MGFKITYIGAECEPERLADLLDLEITGIEDEMPVDEPWLARLRSSGRTLLWLNDAEFGETRRELIKRASGEVDLLICAVHEGVMWSSAEKMSDGRTVWKLSHDGSGDEHDRVFVEGEPPARFQELQEAAVRNQAGDDEVDYLFDVPLEVAARELGFTHDAFLQAEDVDAFRIVKPQKKPSIFRRLFGGG